MRRLTDAERDNVINGVAAIAATLLGGAL